ncbi:MAG TPA: hypothetical protein VJ695_00215, partial [Nitrososphaera sp.]|nr:hypothetical protein [Nitrososphaera sp.]
GDRGNDKIVAGDTGIEAHGGSEDDMLIGNEGDSNRLFGDDGNDRLTGGTSTDSFDCGPGIDTITNFNAAEGDTKTADCENFRSSVALFNSTNTTAGATNNTTAGSNNIPGTDSNETMENVPTADQEETSTNLPTITTNSNSSSTAGESQTTTTRSTLPNDVQLGQQQNQTLQ